eukprot:CAMPEP_0194444142 /NCGR_PEP_ID=MMETSP0176-20130528/127103_1 /TAXON_ID=216777 /ORGANISM="Proboscia alata, Strain PI-D3" /LENGTH=188 /DNA_ID=CAMNT_0039270475 /DNA_START=359 /DNA_END=922 /DNA_ORIENTATION=-
MDGTFTGFGNGTWSGLSNYTYSGKSTSTCTKSENTDDIYTVNTFWISDDQLIKTNEMVVHCSYSTHNKVTGMRTSVGMETIEPVSMDFVPGECPASMEEAEVGIEWMEGGGVKRLANTFRCVNNCHQAWDCADAGIKTSEQISDETLEQISDQKTENNTKSGVISEKRSNSASRRLDVSLGILLVTLF